MEDSQNTPGSRLKGKFLGETYEQYRMELRRFFAWKSRSSHNAEDLVQEIYLQLLRYPPDELRNPLDYLFRIAWRVVNRANRRIQMELAKEQELNGDDVEWLAGLSARRSMGDISEELAMTQQAEQALAQLPEAVSSAFVLFKREGLSYKEIAAQLGISVHTVKKYLGEAVAHCNALRMDSPDT